MLPIRRPELRYGIREQPHYASHDKVWGAAVVALQVNHAAAGLAYLVQSLRSFIA